VRSAHGKLAQRLHYLVLVPGLITAFELTIHFSVSEDNDTILDTLRYSLLVSTKADMAFGLAWTIPAAETLRLPSR
jgi:hypothetical protein